MATSGMCVFNETCGTGPALEHNGDLYSCDHFVEPRHLLGNIHDGHMIEMVASARQLKFGRDKRDRLPRLCLECDVRFACHGECPKNRFIKSLDGQPGHNYLCSGLKRFFAYADPYLRQIARHVLRHCAAQGSIAVEIPLASRTEKEKPCQANV